MNISIFGLGYVGCVSLGCLAQNGHNVIGVDVQQPKVDLINSGQATIVEKDIDQIIKEYYLLGRISATTDFKAAVMASDISIICVGTPSSSNGHLNLDAIYATARQIGKAIQNKTDFHIVLVRSTVLPGTNQRVAEIISAESGKACNEAFAVISNPEFLREGTAVADYYNPIITVIGGDNELALNTVASLYCDLNTSIEITDTKIAEMIKYINNSFHALKVTFANEVGNICNAQGINAHRLMELFCKDTHLNISKAYLKPGFAYGGSCLPKDLKGLVTMAHDHYIATPLLSSIDVSNDYQKQMVFDQIARTKKRNIGLLGLSFKDGTDDLRYSPSVDLAERLLGKGYRLTIYDHNVHLSKLIGANKAFVNEHLPHLADLVTNNLHEAVEQSDVLLVAHKTIDLSTISPELLKNKIIIDVVGTNQYNNYSVEALA